MRHVICSTVPPCLQDEVRSTREQGNSDTRRPKNRSGVARRHFRRSVEQLAVAKGASMTPKCASACTSILSLVSSITGGPRPGHVPGSSGVVPPKATCRMLAPNTSLSGQLRFRLFSVSAILMGTLYHLAWKLSRVGCTVSAPSGRDHPPPMSQVPACQPGRAKPGKRGGASPSPTPLYGGVFAKTPNPRDFSQGLGGFCHSGFSIPKNRQPFAVVASTTSATVRFFTRAMVSATR